MALGCPGRGALGWRLIWGRQWKGIVTLLLPEGCGPPQIPRGGEVGLEGI